MSVYIFIFCEIILIIYGKYKIECTHTFIYNIYKSIFCMLHSGVYIYEISLVNYCEI